MQEEDATDGLERDVTPICRRRTRSHASFHLLTKIQVAVTATADEFKGIYRGKQQHEPDFDAVLDRAQAAGVSKIMLTGMSLHDIDFNLGIVLAKPQQCSLTAGVHPYHSAEPDNEGP